MTNSSPDVDIRTVFHLFIRILLKFEKKNYLKLWKWFTETLNFQENFLEEKSISKETGGLSDFCCRPGSERGCQFMRR